MTTTTPATDNVTTAAGRVTVLGPGSMGSAMLRPPLDRRIADGHGEQGFSNLFELPAKEGRTAS
ncbi:hypothetical protein ACIBCT_17560 [Streptosporangium sp. NPDC050855]|uniref:hypothetical protein n=1 Tax=Streptosporangium sp. NPDC050855 TaxID=3366194 RepID=UPI0037952834